MENIAPNHPSRKHLNEAHVHGEITSDLELRHTATSGKPVLNFTVSTVHGEYAQHHRITAWEKLAERIVANFHKGDYIRVCGRIQYRSYEKDGRTTFVAEIVAWNCGDGKAEPNAHGVAIGDEEIPF